MPSMTTKSAPCIVSDSLSVMMSSPPPLGSPGSGPSSPRRCVRRALVQVRRDNRRKTASLSTRGKDGVRTAAVRGRPNAYTVTVADLREERADEIGKRERGLVRLAIDELHSPQTALCDAQVDALHRLLARIECRRAARHHPAAAVQR